MTFKSCDLCHAVWEAGTPSKCACTHDDCMFAPAAAPQAPAVNSTWRHKNGQIYKVAVLTNVGSTREEYPPTVVYFNVDHDTWWSRPVSEWARSMSPTDC